MDGSVLPNLACGNHVGSPAAGVKCKAHNIVIVLQVEALCLVLWVVYDACPGSMVDYITRRSVVEVLPCVKSTVAKDEFQSEILSRGCERDRVIGR